MVVFRFLGRNGSDGLVQVRVERPVDLSQPLEPCALELPQQLPLHQLDPVQDVAHVGLLVIRMGDPRQIVQRVEQLGEEFSLDPGTRLDLIAGSTFPKVVKISLPASSSARSSPWTRARAST